MATKAYFSDPSLGNAYLDVLVSGSRWETSATLTYFLTRTDNDANGMDDWVQDGAGTGFRLAYQAWARVIGLKIKEVDSAATANAIEAIVADGAFYRVANHSYPASLLGVNGGQYDLLAFAAQTGTYQPGGHWFGVFLHELGHGLGLRHSHGDGDGATGERFPGVGSSTDPGDNDLNSKLYSVMSYADIIDETKTARGNGYGSPLTPMAFDIAAAQAIYGVNTSTAKGNTVYRLPTLNQAGTGYACIWDAGGIDGITNPGNAASTIDLRAATLLDAPGGGGFLSRVGTVSGGFTIANGVVIENATGGGGADLIIGNEAGNTLAGKAGADTLAGGIGADTLTGGAGADVFRFGAIADSTSAARDRIVDFTPGEDRIDLDAIPATGVAIGHKDGVTTLTVKTGAGSLVIDLAGTFSRADLLPGPVLAKTGTSQANAIAGLAVADRLFGLGGRDTLSAGDGDDRALGGAGDDRVAGGGGADTLYGGDGAGWIADADRDTLDGGAGDDRLSGESGDDLLLGGGGGDTLYGGSGDDVLDPGIDSRVESHDRLEGGGGTDLLRLTAGQTAGLAGGVRIALQLFAEDGEYGAATIAFGKATVELHNIEGLDVVLGAGNDTVFSGRANDRIDGGAGNDNLGGWDGDDTILGRAGDDTLSGAGGNDVLEGGSGRDLLDGSFDSAAYSDVASYAAAGKAVTVSLAEADWQDTRGAGVDKLVEIEGLVGSAFNDALTGSTTANRLTGGKGHDTLSGADGDDTLVGGGGRDVMSGGAGADLFVFAKGDFAASTRAAADMIRDFAQGADRVDLSAVDAVTGGKDNAFAFIGTAAFSGVTGQLRYATSGGHTVIYGDINGNKLADFAIDLSGTIKLTAADFVL